MLVTDGSPPSCAYDGAPIVLLAGEAFNNDDVRTFAVGMTGADLGVLNPLGHQGLGDAPLRCDHLALRRDRGQQLTAGPPADNLSSRACCSPSRYGF